MADRRVLAACSLYHLTNDAAVTALPALFPVLREAFGFGYAGVGVLTAVSLGVTVLFQLAFGWLADRQEPRALLSAGIAWLGAGMALLAVAPSYAALVLLVAVARIGSSAYHPVGIPWVAREHRAGLDRAMGVQSSFGDLGVFLGLAGAGALVAFVGWSGVFLFWGAVNLAAAAAGWMLTRGTRPRAVADGPRAAPAGWLRAIAPWAGPLAAGGAAFSLTTAYGPVFLADRFGVSPEAAPIVVSLWIVTGGLAAYGFGRLSRRFGRYPVLLYAYLAVAVAGATVATAPDVGTVVLGLVAFNAPLFVTYPALFAFLADAAEARARGTSFGVIFGLQLGGGALGAYAGGELAAATGNVAAPFYLMAGIALVTFAYLLVLREVRGAPGATPFPAGPAP